MLVLGLGDAGILVGYQLRALCRISEFGETRMQILGFAQEDEESLWQSAHTIDTGDLFRLPARATRMIGRHAQAWKPYLNWLPPKSALRELDEITASGAGAQRWMGRLAFFAADQEIWDTVRSALGRLESPASIALVAAAGGGTGSGLLPDMTYLLERLASGYPRLAYLMLPPPGETRPERSRANTYAALREMYHLKYQTIPFQANYPRIHTLDVSPNAHEAWRRIYLFEPSVGEKPPFMATVNRMALSIAAQLSKRLWRESLDEAQRELALSEIGEPFDHRDNRCFSTCGAFREDVKAPFVTGQKSPGTSTAQAGDRQSGGSDGETARPLPHDSGEGAGSAPPSAPAYSEQGERGFEIRVGRAVSEAADRIIRDILDRVRRIEERSAEEGREKLKDSQDELQELSTILGPEPTIEKTETAKAPEEGRNLEQLGVWPVAQAILQRGALEYLDSLPATTRQEDRDRIAKNSEISPATSHSSKADYGTLVRRLKELEMRGKRAWLSHVRRVNVENRCSALQVLVRRPEFRDSLEKDLRRWVERGKVAEEATTSTNLPSTPSKPPQSEEKVIAGDSAVDKNDNEIPRWQRVIDRAVHDLQTSDRSVFLWPTPSKESCAFAVALVPRDMAEEGGEELRLYLEKKIRESHLDHCKIVDVSDGPFWLYFEDLFHSPCDIRHLKDYKDAHHAEPRKERLYIDVRFLADPRFTELCAENKHTTVLCGNPDCNENIWSQPRDMETCPGCGGPIRSRCGNLGCSLDDLNLLADGRATTCPGCGGFNHADWWRCGRHGKIEVLVSMDKSRCPECIRQHQMDPFGFPESTISVRPDLLLSIPCPNCQRLIAENPSHPIFWIREDLLPFYRNGINGHDREVVAALARKYKLVDGFRCPNCHTTLIPYYQPPGE